MYGWSALLVTLVGIQWACLAVIYRRGEKHLVWALLPLWLLGFVYCALWNKVQTSEDAYQAECGRGGCEYASCDGVNKGISLLASILFLGAPHALMHLALFCEISMGRWAMELLEEEAERARHDLEDGHSKTKGEEAAGSASTTLSHRKLEHLPAAGLHEIQDEAGSEQKSLYVSQELSCEDVEMLHEWRAHAHVVRCQIINVVIKFWRLLSTLFLIYALWGMHSGWWQYCTRVGTSAWGFALLRSPFGDTHVPPLVFSVASWALNLVGINGASSQYILDLIPGGVRCGCACFYLCVWAVALVSLRGEFRRGEDHLVLSLLALLVQKYEY